MVEIACAECGKIVAQKKPWQRFCSFSCQQTACLRNNAATRKATTKRWREANPEKVRAMDKRTQLRNHEKIRMRGRDSSTKLRKLYPWHALLWGAKMRAKNTGKTCDLTAAWAKITYTGYCAITKLAFRPPEKRSGPSMYSPSIDRIDSTLGYTQSNCRFVLWAVNAMKNTGTDEQLYQIAEAILKNRPINTDRTDSLSAPALHTQSNGRASDRIF